MFFIVVKCVGNFSSASLYSPKASLNSPLSVADDLASFTFLVSCLSFSMWRVAKMSNFRKASVGESSAAITASKKSNVSYIFFLCNVIFFAQKKN